jgi:hypothetical protein
LIHDRRRLRDGVTARLLASEVGELVGGRVYAGRGAAFRPGTEIPSVFVETRRSQGVPFGINKDATNRTYEVHVGIVGQGPAADLADPDAPDPELSCADALDEVALPVERALSKKCVEGRSAPLGLPVLAWRFLDDAFDPVVKGFEGDLSTMTIRYAAVTVHGEGDPTTEE